jgi:hypothetical protein
LMYGVVVQTFNLWFPFTPFEVSLLHTLNVALFSFIPTAGALLRPTRSFVPPWA